MSDKAIPIEDVPSFTGRLNRGQPSRWTTFSDAPESTRNRIGASFKVPGAKQQDSKLEGAEARNGCFTVRTEMVIAAVALSFDELLY